MTPKSKPPGRGTARAVIENVVRVCGANGWECKPSGDTRQGGAA